PTTEVAIRRAPAEDLYIVLAGYDVATQTATYAITVNPLVNWIWFGFAVLAFGTGIALLADTVFSFAAARIPSGAASTALLLVALFPAPASPFRQTPFSVAPPRGSRRERRRRHCCWWRCSSRRQCCGRSTSRIH